LNNSLNILVPTLDGFSEDDCRTGKADSDEQNSAEDEGDVTDGKEMLRQHGIVANDFDLVVTVSRSETLVQQTPDNKAVVENARDQCKLLVRRFLPRIIRWSEAISRFGGWSTFSQDFYPFYFSSSFVATNAFHLFHSGTLGTKIIEIFVHSRFFPLEVVAFASTFPRFRRIGFLHLLFAILIDSEADLLMDVRT
jgi:hypothetical protein